MTGPRLSIIPAGAVLDRRLKARDLQVLCVFGKHTDRNGWCCRSQVKMAREMDCARSTVQASIERLVKAGWLQRRMHSTPGEAGERDSAHEYRVMLDVPDEAQDVVGTPADISAPPADSGSAPPADSGSAPINVPLLTDPLPTLGAQARGGGGFNILWSGWPTSQRPDNREAAGAIFAKLTPDEQRLAVDHAKEFHRTQVLRKKPSLLMPYLKRRLYVDFIDPPPIDKDGDFVITPERPEWSVWLGAIRDQHGEGGVQSSVRVGKIIRSTRWPQRQFEAA